MEAKERQVYYATRRVVGFPRHSAVCGSDGYEFVNDGEQKNTWMMKNRFEDWFRPASALTFSHALDCLKRGEKVSRSTREWEGRYLQLNVYKNSFAGRDVQDLQIVQAHRPEDNLPWFPYTADLVAEDWFLVEEERFNYGPEYTWDYSNKSKIVDGGGSEQGVRLPGEEHGEPGAIEGGVSELYPTWDGAS